MTSLALLLDQWLARTLALPATPTVAVTVSLPTLLPVARPLENTIDTLVPAADQVTPVVIAVTLPSE